MVSMQPEVIGETVFIKRCNKMATQRIPFFFLINFEKTSFCISQQDEAADQNILFDIKGQSNSAFHPIGKMGNAKLKLHPMSKEKYGKAFKIVQRNLLEGNSYLTNLTFPTPIETKASLKTIFCLSQAPYKLLFDDQFAVFSPECFIKIQDDFIYSYPMKGTIDASLPNAARMLIEDYKERAEHVTIVDLIRNDLSMVASNVEVTKFRYIDHLKTNRKNLLQVSSEIRGTLNKNWRNNLGELLLQLLPAGSISGAPKKQTIQIIEEAEQQKRGWFTGIFGFFDGKNLDSAVNIRFIEKTSEKGLQFRSGGGITIFSDEEKEYNEMLDKVYVPTF